MAVLKHNSIFKKVLLLSLLLGIIVSCAGGGGGGGGVSASVSSGPSTSGSGPVNPIVPSTTYDLVYNIPAGIINNGCSVYLARVNLSPSAYSASVTGSVSSSSNMIYDSGAASAAYTDNSFAYSAFDKIDCPTAYAVNNGGISALRSQYHASSARAASPGVFNAASSSAVGDTYSFKILVTSGNTDSCVSKNAELLSSGSNVNVWFITGSQDQHGAPIGSNEAGQICANIAQKFDSIYSAEKSIFGDESDNFYSMSGNSIVSAGSAGSNTKINIVVGNLNTSYGGAFVCGYFYSIDYFSTLNFSGSNFGKYFYIDAAIAKADPVNCYSTLAHEFQHMIQFNYKKNSAETWFNEMLSMTAEDLLYPLITGTPSVTDGKSFAQGSVEACRIPLYKASYYRAGLTDWFSGSDVLKSYASAYMFGAYLFRNYGADLITTLSKSTAAGNLNLIKNTLGSASYDEMMKHYYQALLPPYNTSGNGRKSFNNVSCCGSYALPAIHLNEVSQTSHPEPPAFFSRTATLPALRPYGMIIQLLATGGNGEASTVTVSKCAVKTCYLAVVDLLGNITEFEPTSSSVHQ